MKCCRNCGDPVHLTDMLADHSILDLKQAAERRYITGRLALPQGCQPHFD